MNLIFYVVDILSFKDKTVNILNPLWATWSIRSTQFCHCGILWVWASHSSEIATGLSCVESTVLLLLCSICMSQLFPLPIFILFQSILSHNIIQSTTYFQISINISSQEIVLSHLLVIIQSVLFPLATHTFTSIDVRDSKHVGFNYHCETISLAHQLLTKENTYVYFQQREIW